MTEEVRNWINEKKLIVPQDIVLAGVSGGADSVCLLLLLKELQQEMEFSLQVVHVEHGIRGEASDADAVFVENLCERLGVPCHIRHVDVPGYAKERRLGVEEAARELRYMCFAQVAESLRGLHTGEVKIALAHHADDCAETVLFQMVRGSGVRGLSGMRSARKAAGVTYIRPLLGVTRLRIEEYLKERGESYRIDATNEDINYSRNRIRHVVLPALKEINAQAVTHIIRSAGQLGELADYLEHEAKNIANDVCEKAEDGWLIKGQLFEKYPVILQREVLYQMIGELAGSRKDITSTHVDIICQLMESQVGRSVSLPYSLVAERVYEGISVCRSRRDAVSHDACVTIRLQELERCRMDAEWLEVPLKDGVLRMRVCSFSGEIREIPKKTYTKLLNYDKIKCDLQLRKRASGDYLTIDEQGHTKKLKQYFVEEKVPGKQRDDIWILAEEAHVLWIVGKRISADYKIDRNTKHILEIQMSGGKYCED